MKEKAALQTVLILIGGITAISSASILIKFCDDVPAVMIATYRLGIASLLLLFLLKGRGHSLRRINGREYLYSAVSGLFLAFHFVAWITSLKYTSVASSVVLVTTNPIFVGAFSYIFLKEKQNVELVTGIFLCFAGSSMIALGDGGFHTLSVIDTKALMGDGLALTGAVMASGYLIIGSRVRENLETLPYVTLVFSFSALFLLLLSLGIGIPFSGYRPGSYVFMFLLALVPQLIGHTSINWALRHLKASMVAITILGEPVGAAILAYLFFQETVGTVQFAGMLCIFTAIVIASRKGKK